MTHQTEGRIRDKNDLIQLVSIRALFELSENFPTLTVQILCLFRNLVDENSLLVESKGDEILKVVQFWLASELSSKVSVVFGSQGEELFSILINADFVPLGQCYVTYQLFRMELRKFAVPKNL